MKVIKNINKIIFIKGIEIIFTLIFIVYVTNLYKSEQVQEVFKSIAAFNNVNYTNLTVKNQINYSMYPMTDEKAMKKLVPCTLTVSNETYKKENYTLVLKINKSSTMDLSYLHISIDDSIYSLNSLEKEETENEIIFVLNRDTISGESRDYNIRLWLYITAENNLQDTNLVMHFDLINDTLSL